MYKIEYEIDLEKALKKIPRHDLLAIRDKIKDLANNPRMEGTIKLTGRDAYRARAGNYRIIYRIKDKELLVLVIDVDNRGTVYKK